METVLSLRDILDSMVFGMSNLPGFSALSIPVFISNYLFDLFSQFFAILVLFAFAVMAYDSIRQGRQVLKNDLINLSLIIITVFVILNFKDESVTYGNNYSYGIVTLYANLLKKGEDMADAVVYALLYNTPNNGKYSPDNRPDADTPMSGIAKNSFFSFITYGGKVNKAALDEFIKLREEIIKSQQTVLKVLFDQDDFNKIAENAFNLARGPYTVMRTNEKPQGFSMSIFNAGVNEETLNAIKRIRNAYFSNGFPIDKLKQISYLVTDGQTPKNSCVFLKFKIPNDNGYVIRLDKRSLLENTITKMLTMNYFSTTTDDCNVPSKVGGKKGLTYPYILSNELLAISYFWDKLHENLSNFLKKPLLVETYLAKGDEEKWVKILEQMKKISEFYKQASNFIKAGVPVEGYKNQQYSLIFNSANLPYKAIQTVRDSIIAIWQRKLKIINDFVGKSPDSQDEFIAAMSDLMNYYVTAINNSFESTNLFRPSNFLVGKHGVNEVEYPASFKNAYKMASVVVVPYLATATTVSTENRQNNVINFYNNLMAALGDIYKQVSYNPTSTNSQTAQSTAASAEVNKGPSLNQLVNENYGYEARVDYLFPGVKLPLSANQKELEKYLKDNKKAYSKKIITWVDLGYYFAALKAYTSNFIIFNTFVLANKVFTSSMDVDDKALKDAIELAQKYVNLYNKRYSDSAKIEEISTSIANTLTFIQGAKSLANTTFTNIKTMLAGAAFGGLKGLLISLGIVAFNLVLLGAKIGGTYIIVLLAVTILLKIIIVLLPAGFWMMAVLNWFFKSAMMLIMLPINVFLVFFKSRRQVFFSALWKLLSHMLTPVALVATFFVVMVFSIEIDLLLNYFIPFLNDNVIAYFLSDAGLTSMINKMTQNEYETAKNLMKEGHWLLGSLQYVKSFLSSMVAHAAASAAQFTGLTEFLFKILSIIMLFIKTLIVFGINFYLYMLFFKADDYVRETIGEIFSTTTGFEQAMDRISGRFGINRVS